MRTTGLRAPWTVLTVIVAAVMAPADLMTVDPGAGTIQINDGSFLTDVLWHGVSIRDGGLGADGARDYLVYGDLTVEVGDAVTATAGSTRGVRFIVGNDALLLGRLDFSAAGRSGRGGGGTSRTR